MEFFHVPTENAKYHVQRLKERKKKKLGTDGPLINLDHFFNQNALKFYKFTNYTDFDNSQNNKIKD